MGESWRVDGEVSVMAMAMIPSKSLSRQGARTKFLISESEFLVAAELRNFSRKTTEPPRILGLEAIYSRKERSRGLAGHPH
jgi:hypothetical protein